MHSRSALAAVFIAVLAGACGGDPGPIAPESGVDPLTAEPQPDPEPLDLLAQQLGTELLPLIEQTGQSGFNPEQTAFLFALMRAGTANLATREDVANLRRDVNAALREHARVLNAEIRAQMAELETRFIRFFFGAVFGSGLFIVAVQWWIDRRHRV